MVIFLFERFFWSIWVAAGTSFIFNLSAHVQAQHNYLFWAAADNYSPVGWGLLRVKSRFYRHIFQLQNQALLRQVAQKRNSSVDCASVNKTKRRINSDFVDSSGIRASGPFFVSSFISVYWRYWVHRHTRIYKNVSSWVLLTSKCPPTISTPTSNEVFELVWPLKHNLSTVRPDFYKSESSINCLTPFESI